MALQSAISSAKSVHELTSPARSLLGALSEGGQNVLRLTGAPLELISRELVSYEPAARGYELKITSLGLNILRMQHLPARTLKPALKPADGRLIRSAGY